jgi:hypothetical protein
MILKPLFFCFALIIHGFTMAQSETQSQDKGWKEFGTQFEAKKPQTSPDRQANPINPYQFQSYQRIALQVNGQRKNCIMNSSGYVVHCN